MSSTNSIGDKYNYVGIDSNTAGYPTNTTNTPSYTWTLPNTYTIPVYPGTYYPTTNPYTIPYNPTPVTYPYATYPYVNPYSVVTPPLGATFNTSDMCASFLKQYGTIMFTSMKETKKGFYKAKFGDADVKLTFFGGKFELHDNIVSGPAFKNDAETQYFLYGLPIFPLQKAKIQEILKERRNLDATHTL